MSSNFAKFTEMILEARSEASKIAKKSGVKKSDVEDIENAIGELNKKSLSKAIAEHCNLDESTIEKVLNAMGKVYKGGNLNINIDL